jgi:phage terminase small subunit
MSNSAGPGSSLSAKQARFVEEYLIDLNATQAAIRAGYSEKGATVRGSELLANRKVADAIAAAQGKRSKRTEITQDRVLRELARIGFSDIRKAVSWGSTPEAIIDGQAIYPVELNPSAEIDDDTACAISEVALTAQGVRLKMHDKLSALEKIGKHLGMFEGGGGAADDEPQRLTFDINVNAPVGDVRVTKPE